MPSTVFTFHMRFEGLFFFVFSSYVLGCDSDGRLVLLPFCFFNVA